MVHTRLSLSLCRHGPWTRRLGTGVVGVGSGEAGRARREGVEEDLGRFRDVPVGEGRMHERRTRGGSASGGKGCWRVSGAVSQRWRLKCGPIALSMETEAGRDVCRVERTAIRRARARVRGRKEQSWAGAGQRDEARARTRVDGISGPVCRLIDLGSGQGGSQARGRQGPAEQRG